MASISILAIWLSTGLVTAVSKGALMRQDSNALEITTSGNLLKQRTELRGDWKPHCDDPDRITRKPSVCEGHNAPWSSSDLKAAIPEFARLYKKRPIKDNNHGVNVNHAFALWFSVKKTTPTHIIESGVFKGQSTWLLRQAAPNAKIFSLDPEPESQLLYKDPSANTKYFMGNSFVDLASINWDEHIPQGSRASTFVMLDDHQASAKRVAQLLKFGFLHLYYDDNWRKDVYSFNTMCSEPEETKGIPYKDQFGKINKIITMDEHNGLVGYLKSHLDVYYEFPAVWDVCVNHPYYQSLLTEAEARNVEGLPSVDSQAEFGSLYPPYVKLKVDGLPPPALLSLEHSSSPSVVAPASSLVTIAFSSSTSSLSVVELAHAVPADQEDIGNNGIIKSLAAFADANQWGIKHNGISIPAEAFNTNNVNHYHMCQITPVACSLLYKSASAPKNRRILEVGALFGCSASCIASGIDDSKNGAEFVSADLFLNSVKEFTDYFQGLCGSSSKPETCQPHEVTKWALENGGFRKFYDQHLQKLNLTQYVKPVKGDFKQVVPKGEYDVIYLDVTHTPMEIQRNVPFVLEHFAKDGTVLVFDDIHNQVSGDNTNSLADLQAVVKCREGAFIGMMYVCVVSKETLNLRESKQSGALKEFFSSML